MRCRRTVFFEPSSKMRIQKLVLGCPTTALSKVRRLDQIFCQGLHPFLISKEQQGLTSNYKRRLPFTNTKTRRLMRCMALWLFTNFGKAADGRTSTPRVTLEYLYQQTFLFQLILILSSATTVLPSRAYYYYY